MAAKQKKTGKKPRKAPFLIRVRWRIERVLGQFIYWLARRLTRERALKLADFLGMLLFKLFKRYRLVCMDGLEIAFGDKYTPEERLELTRQSQRNLIRTVMDFLRFEKYTNEEFLKLAVKVEGREHLERAAERSEGGIIVLTGHLGSWEYAGGWLCTTGHKLYAVGKEQRDPGITKIMLEIRAAVGVKHIPSSKRGNLELIRALKKKGAILGLIADQNGGKDGIFVDFFGIPASSVRGPAYLALRYDVPVVPVWVLWEGDKYRVEVSPEVEITRTGDDERDIQENTQMMQKLIEEKVRKYPGQWLWAHRRWNTRPEGQPPLHKH